MPLLFFLRPHRWQDYRRLVQQVELRLSLRRAVAYLAIVLSLHTGAMMVFEGMLFGDALWLTLTTVVTVGYGDHSAATLLGRLSTVLLIYLGGIFVLFHSAADYFEYRTDRKFRQLRGRWRWHMHDHILLINSPNINPDRYFSRLVGEFHAHEKFAQRPVLLLTTDFPDGLPETLKEMGLVHYHGHATDPDDLMACDADKAAVIIVLAEHATVRRSDATTFDILHRLSELGTRAIVSAESVADVNRQRLRAAGARIVMRPLRFYPEILVRAISCPGSEAILENLFTGGGDECHGYKVTLRVGRWIDVVTALMEAGIGTAIAYANAGDGEIRCNPAPDTPVDAKALFVIMKRDRPPSDERVAEVLAAIGRG